MVKPSCSLLALLLTLALILQVAGQDVATQDGQDVQVQIDRVMERYGGGELVMAWQGSQELEKIGEEVVPWAQQALASESPSVRLMAAKALISLGYPERIEGTLRDIAADASLPSEVRSAALRMLVNYPESRRTEQLLRKLLQGDESYDPMLRITAARLATSFDAGLAREMLVPLLDVDDPAVQNAAALALGDMGGPDGKVRRILRSLEKQPTPEGGQARLILRNDLLMRKLERLAPGGGDLTRSLDAERRIKELEKENLHLKKDYPDEFVLISDLLHRIENLYADPDRVKTTELIVQAAKGMVGSLDPFSSFMDVKDTRNFQENISGEYAGIGAQVSKDRESQYLLILRPIYGGPAYRQGLLSDDRITHVEGISTDRLRLDEIVKKLKGTPGTPVNIKVIRHGWKEPREFTIQRETIQVPSVQYALLPGGVGYIRLHQFGDTAVSEFTGAADDLEGRGMKGLILDLRRNPGGYLAAAVKIVDNFVECHDKPIVSQRGRSAEFPPVEKFATEGKRDDYPLVVLVNGTSASASEIVSGALQDFKRAVIVGQRTFGKGSVQRLLSLPDSTNDLLGGETTLRLTVQYYYLPSGRSIHTKHDSDGRVVSEGGVEPDIEVKPEAIPLWRWEALSQLNDDKVFEQYLDQYFSDNKELLARLAERGDRGDPSAYPEFQEFFTPRNSYHAEVDDIRRELRGRLRRKLEDERGRQFACDFAEDVQLQRAILEILKMAHARADEIPEYGTFAHKFEEKKNDERRDF
ncbi:MAG: S41 family peptidase [Planctomycetota bacterium]